MIDELAPRFSGEYLEEDGPGAAARVDERVRGAVARQVQHRVGDVGLQRHSPQKLQLVASAQHHFILLETMG